MIDPDHDPELAAQLEEEELFSPWRGQRIELGAEAEPIPVLTDDNPISAQVATVEAAGKVFAPVLAGNFRRAVAKLVDWTLTASLFLAAMIGWIWRIPQEERYTAAAILALFGLVGIWVTWFVYNLLFKGDTLGKKLLRIRVVDERAKPIGLGRAFGRAWAESLSWLFLCLGYVFALLDPQNRAMHDHFCGTRVVLRSSLP